MEIDLAIRVQSLKEAIYISHSDNTLGKRYEANSSFSSYRFLNLGLTTSLGEGKLGIHIYCRPGEAEFHLAIPAQETLNE